MDGPGARGSVHVRPGPRQNWWPQPRVQLPRRSLKAAAGLPRAALHPSWAGGSPALAARLARELKSGGRAACGCCGPALGLGASRDARCAVLSGGRRVVLVLGFRDVFTCSFTAGAH